MSYIPPGRTPRPKHSPDRQFVLWGFAKHKWQSLDDWDRGYYTYFGMIFWFLFWVFSGIFAAEISIVFVIPFMSLSVIGIVGVITLVKRFIKTMWDKFFPEYQEFKQGYKPKQKHTGEQILYGNVPAWFEEEMRSRPRNERECFGHPPPGVAHTPYEWIDGASSGRMYGAWWPVEQMATFDELFEGYEVLGEREGNGVEPDNAKTVVQ